jgi:hypothetical protein
MDEDRFLSTWKDDVWTSGKVAAVQPVSIAEAVQEMANGQFRTGITGAHASHDA